MRTDAIRKSLQPAYQGPYKVLGRGEHAFSSLAEAPRFHLAAAYCGDALAMTSRNRPCMKNFTSVVHVALESLEGL